MGAPLSALRRARLGVAVALVAGCFDPSLDYENGVVPCGPNGSCPPGYECVPSLARCWLEGQVPPPDAPVDPPDAPLDAASDAAEEDAPIEVPDAPLAPDAMVDAPPPPDAAPPPPDAAPPPPDAPPPDAPPPDAPPPDAPPPDAAVVGASLSVTPGTRSFGVVTVDGSSASETFTVENTGNEDISDLAVTLSGSSAGHFGIAASTCGAALAADASCTVDVVFSPGTAGARAAMLVASGGGDSDAASLSGTGSATLDVSVSGSGTVSSTPAGIACPGTCSSAFTSATVSLSQSAGSGATFNGWSGACSGTGSCSVTLDAPTRSVSASFGAPTHTVTVEKIGTGTGTVTSSPSGISCGATCSAELPEGTVRLTANDDAGSIFVGWTGAGCGTSTQCTFTLTGDILVTAEFARTFTLDVTVLVANGINRVNVDGDSDGGNCFSHCDFTFAEGEAVTLRAFEDDPMNYQFTGWSGDCSGGGSTCNLTMDEDKDVNATFNPVGEPQ
jgi:hypothetical protein